MVLSKTSFIVNYSNALCVKNFLLLCVTCPTFMHLIFINVSLDMNMVNYTEVMATYAHKAMIGFKNLSEEPGVWDIFITKHVEVMYFFKTF